MGAAFHTPFDGVSCRLCGATYAKPSDNQFGVCATCYGNFQWRADNSQADTAFTRYIARKLALDIARYRKLGFVGRCECISLQAADPNRKGYQCGLPASQIVNGRMVCSTHAKSTDPMFVDTARADHYQTFKGLLRELCGHDPLFRKAVQEALL